MQGSINFDGSLIGNITGGGGGGGSEVVITPVLTSGTKIADVTVDGEDKDLFAPTPTPPTPATEVSVTQVLTEGTKIASIEVDGDSTDIYSPDYSGDISSLQTGLSTANSNITALQRRMTTAEGNITTLQSDMTDAEGDINTLQSGLSTANSNITALQGRMTTAEGNITTLQSDMTDAKSIIGDGQLDIGNDLTDAVNEMKQSLSDLEGHEYIVTQWVTFTYFSATQLEGTYTLPTAPSGYSVRLLGCMPTFANNAMGAKFSGKFLSSTGNKMRALGTGFVSGDSEAFLVLFLVYKS